MTNNFNDLPQDSDIFRLGSKEDTIPVFPYKKIVDRKKSGTLNIFQIASLSEAQKEKIKDDLKKLGGS
tara:strand:- start:52 stop:255 length:204 start_codon:yes stop_codon:yes gene_type:complete